MHEVQASIFLELSSRSQNETKRDASCQLNTTGRAVGRVEREWKYTACSDFNWWENEN